MDQQKALEKETGKTGSVSIEQYSKYEIHGLGREIYKNERTSQRSFFCTPLLLNFV